jgi:hypothetical protein
MSVYLDEDGELDLENGKDPKKNDEKNVYGDD